MITELLGPDATAPTRPVGVSATLSLRVLGRAGFDSSPPSLWPKGMLDLQSFVFRITSRMFPWEFAD